MRIALTGNPNSGKTTMYNALTGRNEKVGNWAGVTVERKEHPIKKAYYKGAEELIAVDLPGAYSMSPFTSEDKITDELAFFHRIQLHRGASDHLIDDRNGTRLAVIIRNGQRHALTVLMRTENDELARFRLAGNKRRFYHHLGNRRIQTLFPDDLKHELTSI